MFLAEVILVTAVVLLHLAAGSNVTNSEAIYLNVTIMSVTLTTTSETPFPILVTTLSPNDLKAKSKRRLGDLLRSNRGRGRGRATSSSSGEKVKGKATRDSNDESLGLTSLSEVAESAGDGVTKKGEVKSSADRKGWRKWHRKCRGCPDLKLRWREPKIGWICGAYQRARRSFKSLCVMHYRNCQDGTMFVKIADHKCPDDKPGDPLPHGDHFFYEYRVQISGESSKSSNAKDDGSPSKSLDTFSLSGSAIRNSGSARNLIKKKKKPINYRRRGTNKDNKIKKK